MMNKIKLKFIEILSNKTIVVSILISTIIFIIYNIVFFLTAQFSSTVLTSFGLSDQGVINFIESNNLEIWNLFRADTSISSNIAFAPLNVLYYNPISYLNFITPICFILSNCTLFISNSILITNQYKSGFALFEVSNSSRKEFYFGKFTQSTFLFLINSIIFYITPLIVFYIFGGANVSALVISDGVKYSIIEHSDLVLNSIGLYILDSFILMIVSCCLNILFKNKNYALPISLLLMLSFGAFDGIIVSQYLVKPELLNLNDIFFYLSLGFSTIPIILFITRWKKIRF